MRTTIINTSPLTQLRNDLRPERFVRSLTTGLITGVFALITSFSFAALIFSGELTEFLPLAIGMALAGNVVLVLVVTSFGFHASIISNSQDTPAAILASVSMAVLATLPPNTTLPEKFATIIILSFSSTLLTGLFFIFLGRFKLGELIRFIPYPVIGGFLAGTGWLMISGAIGLITDQDLSPALFQTTMVIRWLPGVMLGLGLLFILNKFNHPLLLPGTLALAGILFYLGMGVTNTSLAAARAQGWLLTTGNTNLWQFPLSPTILSQANWLSLFNALPNLLPIIFLSAIAMLLNISGIETIIKQDLDLNHELVINGVGNVLSSFGGGLIGFPALSLSGLNHRLSHDSRLTNVVTATICLTTLFIGPWLLAFVPKFILGGMLLFIGFSFINDWVIKTRRQFPPLEYFVILLILGVIAIFGFFSGVGVGLLAAVGLFVVNYSRTTVIKHALSGTTFQSHVTRALPQRKFLLAHGEQTYILQLHGYLFFGTAHQLLNHVRAQIFRIKPTAVDYVILDFEQVTGLDSTAVLSFVKMQQLTLEIGTQLVFTHLSPYMQRQFDSNGLNTATPNLHFFPDLDHGMEWCETQILQSIKANVPNSSLVEQLAAILPADQTLPELLKYLDRLEFAAGDYLVQQGATPDALFFIEQGQVTAQLEAPGGKTLRLETVSSGRVVGEIGFYLDIPRTAAIRADEPTVVYSLSQAQLKLIEKNNPQIASTLHRLIVHIEAERVIHWTRAANALLK